MPFRCFPPSVNTVTATGGDATGTVGPCVYSDVVGPWTVAELVSASWVTLGGEVGTTAQRPALPKLGQVYTDVTIGRIILWNGTAWIDAVLGTSV
jgi:hypothetical protein